MAGNAAVRLASEHIAPPLQADFTGNRPVRHRAHARDFEVEGVEGIESAAVLGGREQGGKKAVPVPRTDQPLTMRHCVLHGSKGHNERSSLRPGPRRGPHPSDAGAGLSVDLQRVVHRRLGARSRHGAVRRDSKSGHVTLRRRNARLGPSTHRRHTSRPATRNRHRHIRFAPVVARERPPPPRRASSRRRGKSELARR